MPNAKSPSPPTNVAITLEPKLARVEVCIQGLGEALLQRNAAAIDRQAQELHRALSDAVQGFAALARTQDIPPPLRQRLAAASAQVAAQRECLARATMALDRAIEVLMPQAAGAPTTYSASGAVRAAYGSSGRVRA